MEHGRTSTPAPSFWKPSESLTDRQAICYQVTEKTYASFVPFPYHYLLCQHRVYSVFLSSLSRSSQLLRIVSADAEFLNDKVAVVGDTMKGTPGIQY